MNKLSETLKAFIPYEQQKVLKGDVLKENEEALNDLEQIIINMPKTYETDGQGKNALVSLHYFTENFDWYIIEKDIEEEQLQAFGYVVMYDNELGYINIEELKSIESMNLDFHFTPITLGELKKSL